MYLQCIKDSIEICTDIVTRIKIQKVQKVSSPVKPDRRQLRQVQCNMNVVSPMNVLSELVPDDDFCILNYLKEHIEALYEQEVRTNLEEAPSDFNILK